MDISCFISSGKPYRLLWFKKSMKSYNSFFKPDPEKLECRLQLKALLHNRVQQVLCQEARQNLLVSEFLNMKNWGWRVVSNSCGPTGSIVIKESSVQCQKRLYIPIAPCNMHSQNWLNEPPYSGQYEQTCKMLSLI